MSKLPKLYEKAKNNPIGIKYDKLNLLAELVGFIHRNKKASTGHRIYRHPTLKIMLNHQPDKKNHKMAKPYQVKQLIAKIDENDLI